jgi:hypothetical protein
MSSVSRKTIQESDDLMNGQNANRSTDHQISRCPLVDAHATAPVTGDAILKRKREDGVPLRWNTPPPLLFARYAI